MTRSSKTPFFLVALTLLFTGSLQNSSENSFPLNLVRISTTSPAFESMMATRKISAFNYPDPLLFQPTSTVLVATLPIGTPSQFIRMVLDTGSQLSWMSCDNKTNPRSQLSFLHKRSTSFYYLACSKRTRGRDNVCPSSTDNTLTPTCNLSSHLCIYSRLSSNVGGRFATENFTFPHRTTPPVILGCEINGDTRSGAGGILGMNLGPLSFISQLKVETFSYCVPKHTYNNPPLAEGILYLGPNPKSRTFHFQYVGLLPASNPLLYSVPLARITVGGKNADVPPVSANGDGQTIIDSGTQFTYLVHDVYERVAYLVSGLAGPKLNKKYDSFPLCFRGTSEEIGIKVGNMSFEFQKRPRDVVVFISKENLFVDVVPGRVCCFTILPSTGVFGKTTSNIIGIIHQQNLWIQYDPTKKRVGFHMTRNCNK